MELHVRPVAETHPHLLRDCLGESGFLILSSCLQDSLNSYIDTEFWYVDRGIVMSEKENLTGPIFSMQRQEEKWWLPTPKVPVNGLSEEGRRRLQNQREAISQILKAAMAINGQVLFEMEVPDVYWDSLPKVSLQRPDN